MRDPCTVFRLHKVEMKPAGFVYVFRISVIMFAVCCLCDAITL